MSDTVHYVGKAVPVNFGTLEETIKYILTEYFDTELNEDFIDQFRDVCYKEYIIHKNTVYKIEMKDMEYGDVFEAYPNPDGSVNFQVRYYNGGCGFDEAIGYAMDKLNE